MARFFSGHLIPGVLFLSLALRWTISVSYSYSSKSSKKFRSTATMNLPPVFALLQNRLFETIIKMFGGLYGVVIHLVEAEEARQDAQKGIIEYGGEFGDMIAIMYRTNHHYIIYLTFLLSSIVEILIYLGVHLPYKSDQAMLITTFSVEGFMFFFHLMGRSDVDVQFHVMQTVSIIGCVIFSSLEAVNNREIFYALGRCLFVALQGSWFIHTALALYFPIDLAFIKWNLHDQRLIANVTFTFCVHFIVILLLIMIMFLLVQTIVDKSASNRNEKKLKIIEKDALISRREDFNALNVRDYQKMSWFPPTSVYDSSSSLVSPVWRKPNFEKELIYVF